MYVQYILYTMATPQLLLLSCALHCTGFIRSRSMARTQGWEWISRVCVCVCVLLAHCHKAHKLFSCIHLQQQRTSCLDTQYVHIHICRSFLTWNIFALTRRKSGVLFLSSPQHQSPKWDFQFISFVSNNKSPFTLLHRGTVSFPF